MVPGGVINISFREPMNFKLKEAEMKWWMFVLLLTVPVIFLVRRIRKGMKDWRGYFSLVFVMFLLVILFKPMVEIPMEFYGGIFVLGLLVATFLVGKEKLEKRKTMR